MGMARSTYYYQKTREQNLKKKQKADADLVDEIQKIHLEAPVYGHRRIYHALLRQGVRINKKKILRLQREFDLWPVRIRAFTKTTNSVHGHKRFPNLLKDHGPVTGLDEVWVTDIYPAGEPPIADCNGELLASAIQHPGVKYLPKVKWFNLKSADELRKLTQNLNPGDVFLTLGAGDIYKLGPQILQTKSL